MIVETLTKALTALKSCRYVSDRHSEIYGQQEYTEMDVDEAIEAIESCFKFMQNKLDMNSDPVDAFNAGYEDARNSYQSEIAFAVEAAVLSEREKQAEQEPVAWRWSESNGERWFDWRTDWTKHDEALRLGFKVEYAYAAPPRTKDLTDNEIDEIFAEYGTIPHTKAVRAVIAADRRKNK